MNQPKQRCLCVLMLALALHGRGQSIPIEPLRQAKTPIVLSSVVKTKVTEIDVVNQNPGRTEMTIGVEYQYATEDGMPKMGVEVASAQEPSASEFFSSPLADLGHGSRSFAMFPVTLGPAAQTLNRENLSTDQVRVFLENTNGEKQYVYQGAMILTWHIPGAAATAIQRKQNSVAIDSFKQNDSSSGYATIRYNLATGSSARLRLKIYDSAKPASAGWFSTVDVDIKAGPGLEVVRIAVPKEAQSPQTFSADTVEIQLIDKKKRVLASAVQHATMNWVKTN